MENLTVADRTFIYSFRYSVYYDIDYVCVGVYLIW